MEYHSGQGTHLAGLRSAVSVPHPVLDRRGACYNVAMRNIWPLLVITLVACDQTAAPSAAPAAPAGPAQVPGAPTSQPARSAAAPAVPTAPATAGGLTWNHQAPLVRRAAKNTMRAAEYGVEGDDRAELSVFYFGPDQPGQSTVEPNVTRWLGQLAQTDGSDTASHAKRSEIKVGDMTVSLVEARGTFSGGMAMPGAPTPKALPGAMLLGAIASGPAGAVYFKLVGPEASVERARAAMLAMLNSLRPG